MTSYAILLCLALALNIRNRSMLALSLVVGAGIFFPVPATQFYAVCIAVEIVVMLVAFRIDAIAAGLVGRISVLLCVFHVLGWLFDGYPPESPYHIIIKFLEHAELLACILFSRQITTRWPNDRSS